MASAMAMPVARSHCEVGAPHECLAAGGAVLLRRPDGHHPGIMLPPPTAAKQQPTTNNQQPKRSTLTPTGSSIYRDVQSPMVDWQSAAVVGQYLVVTTSASSLYRFFLDLLPSSPPLLVKKPVSAMAPGTGGPSAMGYPPRDWSPCPPTRPPSSFSHALSLQTPSLRRRPQPGLLHNVIASLGAPRRWPPATTPSSSIHGAYVAALALHNPQHLPWRTPL